MARTIWTGTVSFGLVSIPVRLVNATSPKDVRFHQFDRESGRRVRYRRVAEGTSEWDVPEALVAQREERPATEGAEPAVRPEPEEGADSDRPEDRSASTEPVVAFEDVIKGYEVDRDRFVMVSPEELDALRPEQSRTIEIEHFVDLRDIDPIYFEKSYYLAPQRGVGAEKPYGLLLAAMEQAGKVGVARFVLRSKEYLAAIRPVHGVLGLETMFFHDEVRTAGDVDNVPVAVEPTPRELEVAVHLIELLATNWDPTRHEDTYRQRVLELIEGKLETEQIHATEPEAPPSPGIPDLMAALKASVEAARQQADPAAPPGQRPKGRKRRTG
jgi:DNA end-binding protein Ku